MSAEILTLKKGAAAEECAQCLEAVAKQLREDPRSIPPKVCVIAAYADGDGADVAIWFEGAVGNIVEALGLLELGKMQWVKPDSDG